jgi:hypothetical protein
MLDMISVLLMMMMMMMMWSGQLLLVAGSPIWCLRGNCTLIKLLNLLMQTIGTIIFNTSSPNHMTVKTLTKWQVKILFTYFHFAF